MDLATIIKERRTIKKFLDKDVPIELIKDLLNTALWVPNHKMTQPWRFILVQGDGRHKICEANRIFHEKKEKDPERKQEVGQRAYNKFQGVPLFLIAVMKEDPHPMTREEDYASMSCIIQNLGLLTWEQGLGMIWATNALIHDHQYRNTLGILPGEKVVGSLHIGYPEKIPTPRERKSVTEILTTIET